MSRMVRHELASQIVETSRLRSEFRLRSGIMAAEYFDKYQFESQPVLIAAIAGALVAAIPSRTDALAGLELGGVPIATALSLQTGLPLRFIRKKPKDYGTCRIAEGGEVNGLRLVIVEDVITSGGQVIESSTELRRLGAVVEDVLCVIDRESGGTEALAAEGLTLRALFRKSELDQVEARSSTA